MDAHLNFGHRGKHRSKLFDVISLRMIRQVGGPGKCLIFKVLREERFDVVEIASGIGFDEPFHKLELGSGSVEAVDHSSYVGRCLCGVVVVGRRWDRARQLLTVDVTSIDRFV